MKQRRLRVYVAGPISKGDVDANIQRGVECGLTLLAAGFAPMIPHLSYYADKTAMLGTEAYEWWMEHDLAWITVADAMVRLPGESAGADRESAFARAIGLPIFDSASALIFATPSSVGQAGAVGAERDPQGDSFPTRARG